MKKSILKFFLITILLFGFSGCTKSNAIPSDKNSVYKIDEYKMSIEYPSNWNVLDYYKGKVHIAGVSITPYDDTYLAKNGGSFFNIMKLTTKDVSDVDALYNKVIKRFKFFPQPVEPQRIKISNNVEVIKVNFNNVEKETIDRKKYSVSGAYFWFIYNGQPYEGHFDYTPEDKQYSDVFQEILNNLKFLP